MMATMTSSDCYAEARLKATIITCQRKLGRFLQRIAEKESYAALYKSKFMCERYDEEIEELYAKVAELEGYVLASELGLAQITDKRREDQAQRMARILQISAPAVVPTPSAAVTPPPNPSATPRTEQLTLFGPGPAKVDTRPTGFRSASHDWAVEGDVAVGFEHFTEAADEVQTTPSAVIVPPNVMSPSEPAAVIATASTPVSAPQTDPQTERDLSEADKVVAKTEQNIPFTFAYAVDPPKSDSQSHESSRQPSSQSSDSQPPSSQSSNSQLRSSQSSDSEMPSVIARDSVEEIEADSGTASGEDAADVQSSEEHRVAAALLVPLQTERDSLETSNDLAERFLAE